MTSLSLLVALVLYVTCDLSLTTVPGAFVFDPDDSVESVNRGRIGIEILPTVVMASTVAQQAPVMVADHRQVTPDEIVSVGRPVVNVLPRAALDPAPTSEDPH
jgi:hypothetical protein